MTVSPMLDAALRYAAHGWPVLPLRERSKLPATQHGVKDATTDPATIDRWFHQWPNANIGLACNDLLAVDIDPRAGGIETFVDLLGEHPPPDTLKNITGRGDGGMHLIFKAPDFSVKNGELAPGVDVKARDGYLVVPPSVHPDSGGVYTWANPEAEPAAIPDWLLDILRARSASKTTSSVDVTAGAPIPQGKRNAALASLAGSMRRRGMTPVAITAALLAENAGRCRPPLSESEVRQIAASVGKYEPEPVAEKPVHDAGRPHLKVIEVPSVSTITGGDIKFLVAGLVLEGGITMFSGPAGCGKTTLAAAIGGHVACGVPFAGRAVQQRPVLILDRENPLQVVQERLYRLGMTDGGMLRWWGGWLQDEAPSPTAAVVLEWIASLDVMPLIIMDSAVAFLGGADENSSAVVRTFIHPLRRLTQSGVSIVLLHHSGKGANTADYRGSSDFAAAIDTGFLVSNIGDPTKFERLRMKAYKLRLKVSGDVVLDFNEADATFSERGEQPQVRNDADLFWALLERNPGIGAAGFEDEAVKVGMTRGHARLFLKRGVDDGRVRMVTGDRNRHHYYIKGASDDWLQSG